MTSKKASNAAMLKRRARSLCYASVGSRLLRDCAAGLQSCVSTRTRDGARGIAKDCLSRYAALAFPYYAPYNRLQLTINLTLK